MTLQSSGQIKLSEIATEFGGTAPHALSEYYSKGNAPASGEIQIAADFYGTSASIHTTTFTAGQDTSKSGRTITGYDTSTVTGSNSIGSITTATFTYNSETITITKINEDELQGNYLRFSKTGDSNYNWTGWTSATITGVGTILRANGGYNNTGFLNSATSPFVWDLSSGTSYTIVIN